MIRFFKKNKIDLTLGTQVTINITDPVASDTGQGYVNYMRNRRNDSGWSTTGSSDAANTQIDVEFGDLILIDSLFFILQNWKAYTCQYWDTDLATYVDFSTPISEAANAAAVKLHEFESVETTKIRIIVTGTMVPDAEKTCAQIVCTEAIGAFTTLQPRLENVVSSRNRRSIRTLSGKSVIMRSSGAFSCSFRHPALKDNADVLLIEQLHDYYEGFLVWLCGGDESQFSPRPMIGYRLQDLMLMNIESEYTPRYRDSFYRQGAEVSLSLVEVI